MQAVGRRHPEQEFPLLRGVKNLDALAIGATDGPIGTVKDFYFDDEAWVVRDVVGETRKWLGGRKVLITPYSLGYYGYPYYWAGMGLWGAGYYLGTLLNRAGGDSYSGYQGYLRAASDTDSSVDTHLRRCSAVKGYHIRASDGEIGRNPL